jgi:pimeloyl-ACP methyl ester carboxylesterase
VISLTKIARGFRYLLLTASLGSLTGCTSLLYYPTRYIYVEMEEVKPAPEDWVFRSANGQTLNGWYFNSQKKAKGVFVLFQGNGQNRSAHFVSLYWVLEEGFDLFVFDYPGYGQSEGVPSPENTVEAGVGALQEVKAKRPGLPIIVYGHSLGGAIAARAVYEARDKVRPTITFLSSTFLSYRSAARKVMSNHWLTWLFQPLGWVLMNDEWAPKDVMSEIPGPLVVIHSKKDEIVSYELGEDVFARLPEPKEFWPIERSPDRPHNQMLEPPHGLPLRQKILAKIMATLPTK